MFKIAGLLNPKETRMSTPLLRAKLRPKQLRVSDLRIRIPLNHPAIPFIVLWSQKAACTIIMRWYLLQLGVPLASIPGLNAHVYERDVLKRRPNYFLDLRNDILRRKPIIKFVRDPYARAYSSFLDASKIVPERKNYWGTEIRKRIASDLGVSPCSFKAYLEWLTRQNVNALNMHIMPQYVTRDDYFNLRVFPVENLETSFAHLERQFNLAKSAASHPEIFESGHFHAKTEMSREKALALLSMPTDGTYVRFNRELARGTELEDLVRASFECDIERYGYG